MPKFMSKSNFFYQNSSKNQFFFYRNSKNFVLGKKLVYWASFMMFTAYVAFLMEPMVESMLKKNLTKIFGYTTSPIFEKKKKKRLESHQNRIEIDDFH